MKPDEEATIIGPSVKIRGDIVGSENFRIAGEVHGSVRSPGSKISIMPTARMRADLIADEVIIAGRVEGNVWATGRVELRAGAMVIGDIFAASFVIEHDAMFRGQVDPARAKEIPQALPAASPSVSDATVISGPPRSSIVPPSSHEPAAPRTPALPAGLAAATALISRNAASPADSEGVEGPGSTLFPETKVEA